MTTLPLHLIFFLSLGLSLIFTPLFIILARRLKIVDQPAHRKIHKEPVSYLGGIAIFLSLIFSVATVFFFYPDLSNSITSGGYLKLVFILGPTFGITLVGLWDDIKDISPRYKFMGQLLFVLAIAFFGFRFEVIHLPGLSPVSMSLLSVPVTVFWILSVVTAFNMVDGVDGLASSLMIGSLTLLAGASALLGNRLELMLSLGGLGAVLGFIPFNWKPAKIYLGDAGSSGMGMFLACSLVALGQDYGVPYSSKSTPYFGQPFYYQILIVTLIVAYPAMEIILSVTRRMVRGKPIWRADKGHIHHRLKNFGWKAPSICLFALGLSFLPGLAAFSTIAQYHGWAAVCLLLYGMVLGVTLPALGFFDIFKPHLIERLKPHYQIAHHFIAMQKIKLGLAKNRENVLTLVGQTCHELGVKGIHILVLPDERQRGGLDFCHGTHSVRLGDLSKEPKGTFDKLRLPKGQGGAEWMFEPKAVEEELDVEYKVLVSEFIKEVMETLLRMGHNEPTLEYSDLSDSMTFSHDHVSGHSLRKGSSAKLN